MSEGTEVFVPIRTLIKTVLVLGFSVAALGAPTYQDNSPKPKKSIATIWPQIPFVQGGDIGQYQKTMSQDRDSVRKMLWGELMEQVQELAKQGAAVELMLEPMANILMMFDQVHDIHKAKDVVNIDLSLEAQFKSTFDNLFTAYDVRDNTRKAQFGSGTNQNLLEAYIRQISRSKPFGEPITQHELNVKKALEIFEEIDYMAYGTFTSLGRGRFQLTFHLTGNKNGVNRAFIAQGRLTEALNDLAEQVFDYFQKNVYPDWETPHTQLTWMPAPLNPEKSDYGYVFSEARQYCQQRGYRLPFAKELLMAESGTQYKPGGIRALKYGTSYAVADHRWTNGNHWITPGHEERTGGAIQPDFGHTKGSFWCVSGKPHSDMLFIEELWSLLRKWRMKDDNIYRALETIRYEIGDSGATEQFFAGIKYLRKYDSTEEALAVLKAAGIKIKIPTTLLMGSGQ